MSGSDNRFEPKYVLIYFSGYLLKRKRNEDDAHYQFRQVLDARALDLNKGYIEPLFHYIIPSVGCCYVKGRPLTMCGWDHPGHNLSAYAVLVVGESISEDQQKALDELMKNEFPAMSYRFLPTDNASGESQAHTRTANVRVKPRDA